MPDQNKIQHYAVYLRMYGGMMLDLSLSKSFICKLIEDDDLTEFEKALRTKIEKSPRF